MERFSGGKSFYLLNWNFALLSPVLLRHLNPRPVEFGSLSNALDIHLKAAPSSAKANSGRKIFRRKIFLLLELEICTPFRFHLRLQNRLPQ